MKKFITKLGFMLTIVLLIIFPMNSLYENTNRFANQNYELAKFENIPDQIDFANFGSSHGQLGFYYPEEGVTTFNFALSSQTPEYDLALLKDNLNHFSEDAILIFPISYFTPYLFSHEDDFEFKVRNQRYYEIIDYQNIIDFNWIDMLKSLIQPLNGRDILNYDAFLNDDIKFHELNNTNGNFPLSNWEIDNSMSDKSLKDDAIARWAYWKMYRANLDLHESGNIKPDIVKIYHEIMNICNENNLIPVFVTLPVTDELNSVVDSEFYPIFRKDIEYMLDEIGSPIYFDFSHHKEFKGNLEYFIDTDHLSKAGALRFTEILIDSIEKVTSKQLFIANESSK